MGQSPLDDDELELDPNNFKGIVPLVLIPTLIMSILYQLY